MFSKLRCLNHSAAARGSLWRTKTYLDKTGVEVRDTNFVTGRYFFCQKKGDIHSASDGAYLNCSHVNKRSSGQLRARLSWEDTKCQVKHEISPVKHSQLRRSNLDQKAHGTTAGQEKGLLRLLKSKHANNIVQSHFFSTTARSFLAPSIVLRGMDTDEVSNCISRTKTAISGKEQAEESSCKEDPMKNRYDQENPLNMINDKAGPVIETDAVVAEAESFWPLLMGCDTIEEVLTLMEPKIEREELSIDQYLEVIKRLKDIICSLQQENAFWPGEDEEMSYSFFVSMLLTDSRASEFESLGKSSSFQRLQDNLVLLLPEMTASQYTSCLEGLMWLRVDPTSSTIVEFISHLDDFPYKDFTVITLGILSLCLSSLPRPDLAAVRYLYPRLKALIEDDCVIAPDRKTLLSLVELGHIPIPDVDTGVWLSQQILKISETADILKDPKLASQALDFCSQMLGLSYSLDPTSGFYNIAFKRIYSEQVLQLESSIRDLTDIAIINLMDICDSLKANDVAKAASSAAKMGIYDLPWADTIKQRSLDLFYDETLPVAQRLQLLVGLPKFVDMDNETREKTERMILTMLKDADVLSTSFVLKHIGHFQVNSPEIVALCEEKIVQTFDRMMKFKSFAKGLFLSVSNCAMQDKDKHLFLQTKLLSMPHINLHMELVLKYITTQTWLDSSAKVLARVTEYASSCSFKGFLSILRKIDEDKWLTFKNRLKRQGILKGETLEAVRSFEKMVAKRNCMAVNSMNDDPQSILSLSNIVVCISPKIVCLEMLMRAVEKTLEKMPLNERELNLFLNVLYSIPISQGDMSSTVLNRVIDSFDQLDDVNEDQMEKLLTITSTWFSVESEEVTAPLKGKVQDLLQRNLDLLTENRNLVKTLYSIESLCYMGIFPEAALVDLLNVDTMAKLDRFIAESDSDRGARRLGRIQEALVNINRFVVIDKKDMKIPWFMENYTEEERNRQATDKREQERLQLKKKKLYQILGEGNFFPNWKAEYGYTISFACLVDKNNNLLPFNSRDFKYSKQPGVERVAVEFRRNRYRVKYIRETALKKEHLQKLGYRVVELNEWEHTRSAWSNPKERFDYCRKKILGQLSEELAPPPGYAGCEDELDAYM